MKLLLSVVLLLCQIVRAQGTQAQDEGPKLSETLGADELLLLKEPGAVTDPLDFGQIAREKLGVFSSQGMAWAASRFRVEGMEATDPYQPGRPLLFAEPAGVAEFRVDHGVNEGPTLSYTFRTADSTWHFSAAGFFTASPLFSNNLPPPGQRGTLQRADEFNRYSYPHFELGGPVTRWFDLFFSGSGRWSDQTAPLEVTDRGIHGYDLDATIRANIRPNAANRIDLLIIAARANDSAWSLPFALETLSAWSGAPPILFQPNLREEDHLDYVQTGWHRNLFGGELEARYNYSAAHADTVARSDSIPPTFLEVVLARLETAYIELTNGATHGGPVLQSQTVQPRHGLMASWRRMNLQSHGISHTLSVNAYLSRALIKNRFEDPPFSYAITADGAPASAVTFNTAVEAISTVRHLDFGIDDQIRIGSRVTVDAGVIFSGWNGGTPQQGLPPGGGPLMFAARPDLIVWKYAAPRLGVSVRAKALVLRAGYGRSYYPLAGRYLDFGNGNAVTGLQYKWNDGNHDGVFDYFEEDGLLRRFGGAYSGVDPALKQPYNDEFYAAAELALPRGAFARVRVFERTEKNRVAAVNTGVPFSAYHQRLFNGITVYDQDPLTFAQDFYTLTNPAGLIMQQRGLLAEAGFNQPKLSMQGSLYVGQSRGMTNPGNNSWENDSGLAGSLYADPNTLINANGRPALDPGYIGKVWAFFPTPARWGKLEVLNSAVVVGGYPYARRLLVTGLAQGPFMIDATPRGEGGGFRTDAVFQWNLRIARAFELKKGTLRVSGDLFDVLNRASKLRVDDLTGSGLPTQIQPPRFLRVGVSWGF